MKHTLTAWSERWKGSSASHRGVVIGLLAVLAALIWYLLAAETPWNDKLVTRIADGKRLRLQDFITIGLWWASAINLVLVSVLLVTSRLWIKPLPASVIERADSAEGGWEPGTGRWFFHMVAAAVLIAGVLGWPRMSLSLWGDEAYMLRAAVLGAYEYDRSGDLTLERLTLAENLWLYKNPNNHLLLTLLSRASLEVWLATAYTGGLAFSEFAYRLPSFVAGLLAIPAVALFLRRMGLPLSGAIAALFLAVHPWFMKYATEARGYALVLLFLPLMFLCLANALHFGKWKWWLLFAAAQFAIIYSYPAALFVPLCANGVAFVALVTRRSRPETTVQLGRWFVANVAAAVVTIQLLAPCVPQMLLWMQRDRAKGELGFAWLVDFWGYLGSGMAWKIWDPANPLCRAVEMLPLPAQLLLSAGLLALVAMGVAVWFRRGLVATLFALAMLAAPLLGYFQASLTGNLLYFWYLIYALPPLAIFVGTALASIGVALGKAAPGWKPLRFVPAGVFLVAYTLATQPQRTILRAHPLEAQRESVRLSRPVADPMDARNDKILTADFVFTTPTYDPLAIRARTPEDLRGLMRRADVDDKSLYVNFGSEGWARHMHPELMAVIENPEYFEQVERLWGLDQHLTRLVYRYRRGSVAAVPAQESNKPTQNPALQPAPEPPQD